MAHNIKSVLIEYEEKVKETAVHTGQPVSSFTRQVCVLFKVEHLTHQLCLRISSEYEEILTDENIRHLNEGDKLKLTSSPKLLALEYTRELKSEDQITIRKTLFNLKKYLIEEEFAKEFSKKGLERLQELIVTSQGNILAQALLSLQTLTEHEFGWENFSKNFISALVAIIVKQNLVNICRPATEIIIKLVLADKSDPNAAIQCYGFNVINNAISSQQSFLPTLVGRLLQTDDLLRLGSMNLINVLFRHATDQHRDEFVHTLDMLHIRNVVLEIIYQNPAEELMKQVYEFQRLLILEGNRRKTSPVNMHNKDHVGMLDEIWGATGIEPFNDYKWRLLGFESERPHRELSRVGVLGLELLYDFVTSDTAYFSRIIGKQTTIAEELRCPLAQAHIEVVEILADHWELSTGYSTSTTCHPLLFSLEVALRITLRLFLKLWDEVDKVESQEATTGSVEEIKQPSLAVRNEKVIRVAATVRSHFRRVAHMFENPQPELPLVFKAQNHLLNAFESQMLNIPYSTIRQKQLAELEAEDDLLFKMPVRWLYKESFEFIKNQRIGCLMAGAWFPITNNRNKTKLQFRFCQLSPNGKFLHYDDFMDVSPDRIPSFNIEISLINGVHTGKNSTLFTSRRVTTQEDPRLCFSLTTTSASSEGNGNFTSLMDFVCTSPTQYSEWTDGFNMLLDQNITSDETAAYIQELTDMRLKVALLDITAYGIEIPSMIKLPEDVSGLVDGQFWYDGEYNANGDEDGWTGKEEYKLSVVSDDNGADDLNVESAEEDADDDGGFKGRSLGVDFLDTEAFNTLSLGSAPR
ncbi:hypothetical protein HK098_004410 [Nowakowskiella sp. JEL0407]|nr:hypothetical protein HK098_004410 [Nowakowskiella sp. JEL0407]